MFAGREGDRIYRRRRRHHPRPRSFLDRRAASSTRSSIAGSSWTTSSPPRSACAHRSSSASSTSTATRRTAATAARAPSMRRAAASLCTSRAPLTTTGEWQRHFVPPANAMTPAVEFIPPYSEDVEFDDILPNVGLSFRPWDQPHVLPVVRGRPFGAAHRQPLRGGAHVGRDTKSRRPTPESEMTKSYRPGLAPESSDQHRFAGVCTRSTTRIASCRRSTPNSASASIAMSATWTSRASMRRSDIASASCVIADECSASFNDSELKGSLRSRRSTARSWWRRRSGPIAARLDLEVTDRPALRPAGQEGRRSLLHRPQRRNRAGLHRGRSRSELRASTSAASRRRGVAVQRDQPARRGIFRQHQLGHRRRYLRRLLLDRRTAHRGGRRASASTSDRSAPDVASSVLAHVLILAAVGTLARRRGGTASRPHPHRHLQLQSQSRERGRAAPRPRHA